MTCLFFSSFLQSEYLGEDGEWYFYYTGQEGVAYNLTHVFYATEQERVNIAKIQAVRLFSFFINKTNHVVCRVSWFLQVAWESESGYLFGGLAKTCHRTGIFMRSDRRSMQICFSFARGEINTVVGERSITPG